MERLKFAMPLKAVVYSEFILPFEMLLREITSLDVGNFDKLCVKCRLRGSAYSSFKQVSQIFDKNPSSEEIKVLNKLVKNLDLVTQT